MRPLVTAFVASTMRLSLLDQYATVPAPSAAWSALAGALIHRTLVSDP